MLKGSIVFVITVIIPLSLGAPGNGKAVGKPYYGNCDSDSDCPIGTVCLLPGFLNASDQAQKKCYRCDCTKTEQCYFENKSVFCNCTDSGFTGSNCETNIDDCIPQPCQNNGTCTDAIKNYTCTCTDEYYGRNCQEFDDCFSQPCLNGGNCTDGSDDYECDCLPEYYGTNCEVFDDCFSQPCLNGGTCTDGDGDYTCQCPSPFFGNTCELKCPSGWHVFEHSCYWSVTTEQSWYSSRTNCQSNGGDLVKITSLAENAFVRSKISASAWIGLNDLVYEGTYVWVSSGTAAIFTHWGFGEPNNLEAEDCIEIFTNGYWNDVACGVARRSVCEREPIVV